MIDEEGSVRAKRRVREREREEGEEAAAVVC